MRKLFILGVDGATFDLLKPWVADGDLPGFGQLMSEGASTVLQSTIPPLSPVAWTSIATGVNAGKHGVYDFMLKQDSGDPMKPMFTFATGGDRKTKAFWEILSEQGKTCIINNMPCSFPPDEIKGLMISGWDGAREKSKSFYPPSLYEDVNSKIGGKYYFGPFDILSKAEMVHTNPNAQKNLHGAMMQIVRQRREVMTYLLREKKWDLNFSVFTESDAVMHRFWDTLSGDNVKDGAIFQVYQEIDYFVQDLLKDYGNDIDIMVVSDHGFTDLKTGIDLNYVLSQHGLLKRRFSPAGVLIMLLFKYVKTSRRFLKSFFRKKRVPERLRNFKPRHMSIDFEKSQIFFEGTYPFFYLLESAKGEGEAVYNELKEALLAIEYEGAQVFKDVLPLKDVLWGPYVDEFADFIGIINNHFEVAGADAFMQGGIRRREVFCNHVWNANHSPEGVFIYRGEDTNGEEWDWLNVYDIAPTVLTQYGIPVPKEMDGTAIKGVVGDRKIASSDYNIYKDPSSQGGHLDKEDVKAVQDRLKALGYL